MEKRIQKILEGINKAAGEKIAFAGERKPVEGQSTGIEALDFDMGCNGYPKGRITEIFGQEGVAKTSMALWGVAQAQRDGLQCLYIDAEYALDLELAETLGVDLDKLIIVNPNTGEEAITIVETMLREKAVDFIVIDSVPSINPTPELEAEVNKPTMGGQARLWAASLRRLVPLVAKQKAVLLLINQVRVNIMGGMYDPWVTPGGKALKFYASVRLMLKKRGVLKADGDTVGQEIEYQMRKNKVGGMANDTGVFQLIYNKGFESVLDLVTIGAKKGIVTRRGSIYYFGDVKLGQGKEKSLEMLEANPDLKQRLLAAL